MTPEQARDEERAVMPLQAIADVIEGWLEWDLSHRRNELLDTDSNTHLMAIPCSHWPSHGQLRNWITSLRSVKSADQERDAVVAWLREYGNHVPEPNCVRCNIAASIERGEHRG